MIIKPALQIDYENDTVEQIVAQIEMAIEQHESFLKVKKLDNITDDDKARSSKS